MSVPATQKMHCLSIKMMDRLIPHRKIITVYSEKQKKYNYKYAEWAKHTVVSYSFRWCI
jgi:hypothetical protein